MTAVLWGLAGALFIGVSDCIARRTAQRVSVPVLFLFIMGLSTLALTLVPGVSGGLPVVPETLFSGAGFGDGIRAGFTPRAYGWLASAGSGLLNLLVLFFLYRALARGPVAVASPAASTFTILLILINAVAGEPLTFLQGVAGVTVFGGVVMLAQRQRVDEDNAVYRAAWIRSTALYGLGAAVCIAVRMFLAQEAGTALAPGPALYLNRVFSLAGTLGLLIWLLAGGLTGGRFRGGQYPLRWPDRATLPLVLVQTALEMAALGVFLVGSAGGGRVGAAIGFSAFSVITALTARVWLGERIGLQRSLWMLVVLAGLVLAVSA